MRGHLVSRVAAVAVVSGVAAVAVSQTSADERAYDQTADNTWSVISATVTPLASAKHTAISTPYIVAISTSYIVASEAGATAAKSTSVKAPTVKAAAAVETTTPTMSAPKRERRGRRGKRNCQTGTYRSRFLHNCFLHYGLKGEQP
jgi:hypothetical protein